MPEEARMRRIHENFGFKIFKTGAGPCGDTILYRQAEIEQAYQALHSKKAKNDIRMRAGK
jgi:hypothetical protein